METKLNQYVYKSKCHDFMIQKIRNHVQCKYAIWIYQLWSHYFLQEQLFIYIPSIDCSQPKTIADKQFNIEIKIM